MEDVAAFADIAEGIELQRLRLRELLCGRKGFFLGRKGTGPSVVASALTSSGSGPAAFDAAAAAAPSVLRSVGYSTRLGVVDDELSASECDESAVAVSSSLPSTSSGSRTRWAPHSNSDHSREKWPRPWPSSCVVSSTTARARGQTTHRSFALGLQQWQDSVRRDARPKAEDGHRAAHAGQEKLQLLHTQPIIAVQQRLAQRGPRCLRNTGSWVP